MSDVEDAEARMPTGTTARKNSRSNDNSIAGLDDDGTDSENEDTIGGKAKVVGTSPLGLAETFIAAGARTVLQKIWYDEESALADTVSRLMNSSRGHRN